MTKQHSDQLDIANELIESTRDKQVAYIRQQIKPIESSLLCLNCERPTLNGARWCDKACCDQYCEQPNKLEW